MLFGNWNPSITLTPAHLNICLSDAITSGGEPNGLGKSWALSQDCWLQTKELALDHNSQPKSLLFEAPVYGLWSIFLWILTQCSGKQLTNVSSWWQPWRKDSLRFLHCLISRKITPVLLIFLRPLYNMKIISNICIYSKPHKYNFK